jgi:U3 small nucleolar RNA-associated protein 10
MRRVYTMANATESLALLSTNFLRALFITLADDTLAFLAGIWLTTPQDEVAHAALCHAVAFFAAHGGMESPVDFQTVLPALLVALESSNKNVREAAAECVVLMSRMAGAKKAASVYAIDSIYGSSSGTVLCSAIFILCISNHDQL